MGRWDSDASRKEAKTAKAPDRNSVKGPAESEKNLSGGVEKNSEEK